MNILFLTSQLPNRNSGGNISTRNFFDYFCLSQENNITLISLIKKDDVVSLPQYIKGFTANVKQFEHFVIDKPRSPFNYLCSIVKNLPLSIYRNYDPMINRKIAEYISTTDYNLIICNNLIMSCYIPKDLYSKTVLIDHNAEFIIWERFAKISKNIFLKIAVRIETSRMRKYETGICNKFRLTMGASEDIKKLKLYAPTAQFFMIHHLGNDDLLNKPPVQNNHSHCILFVGTMTWEANRHGIQWFVKYVYPKIKVNIPSVSLTIAGKYDKPFLSGNIDTSIHIIGFASDLSAVYDSAQIFICPLWFGSGTKLKVLDAMYKGLPVVTTSIGVENIDLIDGEHCYIADDPDEFAGKTTALLDDSELWDKFSRESRGLASREYRREKEYLRLDAFIHNML
jgi:glycosyltransferase involved in cell wall biosynthesis